MSDFFQTYYEGITKQIQAELDHMNNLITHMGEKGRANENIIRDFLINFLPKKYDIGTGILIDRKGNPSKQCDIVIYDKEYHPDYFGQKSTILFPVDVVYAIIEVKTSLDQGEIKESIENIVSVKKLDIIPNAIPISGSHTQGPKPPLGIIFAFDSKNIKRLSTIENNFKKHLDGMERKYQPDLGIILRKGIIMYHEPAKSQLKLRRTYVDGEQVIVSHTLLNFLKRLYEKLKTKKIQTETILFHYFGEDFLKDYDI